MDFNVCAALNSSLPTVLHVHMKHQATCSRSDVYTRPGVHGGAEHELDCSASVPLSRIFSRLEAFLLSVPHDLSKKNAQRRIILLWWLVGCSFQHRVCVFTTAQMFSDSLSNATIKYL